MIMKKCEHENFDASVAVNRLADIGRFNADVSIKCHDCGVPMRFIGLPAGADLNGASTSVGGTEGRFAIAPKGEVLSELEGTPLGFTVKKTAGGTVIDIDKVVEAIAKLEGRCGEMAQQADFHQQSGRLTEVAEIQSRLGVLLFSIRVIKESISEACREQGVDGPWPEGGTQT